MKPEKCPPPDEHGRCPKADYKPVILPCKQVVVITICKYTNEKCPGRT